MMPKDLARSLVSIGAIKFGNFRLKLHETQPDAPLSPIYIDLRVLRSSPPALAQAIRAYEDVLRGLSFDGLADVPTAGTPIAAVLAYKLSRPMLTPRMDKKAHGAKAPVDGAMPPGSRLVLVDDLITTAASKIEAIDILRAQGYRVQDVVVLVDREQGGAAELTARGCRLHASFTLRSLVEACRQEGLVSEEQWEKTRRYFDWR